MAIKFKTKTNGATPVGVIAAQAAASPVVPPWEDLGVIPVKEVLGLPEFPPNSIYPAEYTILLALDEWGTPARKGETLMLVNKATGEDYQVIAHDKLSGKTKLKNGQGALLNPKVGIREAGLYSAIWR